MLEALAGAGAGAAAMFGLYASLAPRTRLCGPVFYGNGRGSRQLALTFDDGPNDPHTLRLLDILEREGVRATFFLIGVHAKARPGIVREILSAGHAIGNHTQTHPRLPCRLPCSVLPTGSSGRTWSSQRACWGSLQ